MFPRTQRVHRTTDILRVFRQGERARVGNLTLFFLPDSRPESLVRATVVVDKKLSKKAVVRNKVKRQLREILKKVVTRPGMYVLRGFEGADKLSQREMVSSVQQASQKLRG